MKKETFIMTVEYNERGDNLLERLNITMERAHELFEMAEKDGLSRGEGTAEEPFDAFESMIRLLNANELTGNEILMYLVNGYTMQSKLAMQRRSMSLMGSIEGLMDLLGGLEG